MTRIRLLFALALLIAVGCGKKPDPTSEVAAAPEPKPAPSGEDPEKAARDEARANLKQVGVAMRNCADTLGFLPAGFFGPKGELGLSWRVQILPFLDQEGVALYRQFKLDEPWDSEHNKKLLAKMPKLFASPGKGGPEGKTYLRSFTGKTAVIPLPPQPPLPNGQPGFPLRGLHWATIADGSSNTLMVAEAAEPVEWTKPEELPYPGFPGAPNPPPLPKLGGVFAGGFHGLMADGAVHFFPATLSEKTLRAMITVNGGEVLDKDATDILFPPKPKKPGLPSEVPSSLPDAAARKTAVANYQRILIGAHSFQDAYGHLPAGVGVNKAVGLSWRVQILPYIGEGELYQQFKLDEPWDSDHNRPLIEKMPKAFESPGKPTAKGHTFIRTTQGSGGIIPTGPDGKPQPRPDAPAGSPVYGRKITDIQDGTSNTILFVEASEAVPWTKPDELPIIVSGLVKYSDKRETQLATKLPPLGGVFADGLHAVMADGRITFYKTGYPDAELAKMFGPADGLPVQPLGEPDKILYSIPFTPPAPTGKPPGKK